MQAESDFPALSEAIGDINRIASSDREGVNELSNHILKDFALTNKLLKLANVAFYNQVGGGSISTISRAVVILGFDAVRSIALSLILFDNLENKAHAQQLKEEFVKVLYAGMLAREMAGRAQVKDVEEAFIGAMLHNLGRMLAMFYFPEETALIRQRVEAEGLSDARVSTEVLGVSFENLGIGIARSWGFPDQLVQSMKKLPDGKIRKSASNVDRLRALAGFSNELCEVILDTPDADRSKALAKLTARFGDTVPVTAEQLSAVMEKSMQDIAQFALVVNVNLKHSDFARQASKWAGMAAPGAASAQDANAGTPQGGAADAMAELDANVLHQHAPTNEPGAGEPGGKVPRTPEEIQSILASGLQDVSNSLIDDTISINDILRMILEAMYTGMGFGHVLLCIKDGRRNAMCGKFGFGDGAQSLVKTFDFSLAGSAGRIPRRPAEQRRHPDLRHRRPQDRDADSGVVSPACRGAHLRVVPHHRERQAGRPDLCRPASPRRHHDSRERAVPAQIPAQSGGAGHPAVAVTRIATRFRARRRAEFGIMAACRLRASPFVFSPAC